MTPLDHDINDFINVEFKGLSLEISVLFNMLRSRIFSEFDDNEMADHFRAKACENAFYRGWEDTRDRPMLILGLWDDVDNAYGSSREILEEEWDRLSEIEAETERMKIINENIKNKSWNKLGFPSPEICAARLKNQGELILKNGIFYYCREFDPDLISYSHGSMGIFKCGPPTASFFTEILPILARGQCFTELPIDSNFRRGLQRGYRQEIHTYLSHRHLDKIWATLGDIEFDDLDLPGSCLEGPDGGWISPD